eukprot:m.351340 g.351340  ORF g.351340 m.351340 type:complete len:116 (-) comp16229_c0_seq1:150-497(-)
MAEKAGFEGQEKARRIRITLCSKNVKKVEAVCAAIVGNAKKDEIKVRGPVRMPTKQLKIVTRKTPNGEGSKTWDRFTMRIRKRVIDVVATSKQVRDITSMALDPEVTVEVTTFAA